MKNLSCLSLINSSATPSRLCSELCLGNCLISSSIWTKWVAKHEQMRENRSPSLWRPSRRNDYCLVLLPDKWITLIACITSDGSFIRAYIVISRKPFEDQLFLYGFARANVDISRESNNCPGIEIFNILVKNTFVAELVTRDSARTRSAWGVGGFDPQ
jgi:hypothetical protein